MKNVWNKADADECVKIFGSDIDTDLSLLTYATRLVGSQPDLAMHGGGNTSIKTTIKNIIGESVDALFVKASGVSMECIDPNGFVALDLMYLKKLRAVTALTDQAMGQEFQTHMLAPSKSLPSIETLMHAFLPFRCIIHTHPSSILCLTNRKNGEITVREALGNDVACIPYANAGIELAKNVAEAVEKKPGIKALIVAHHGLITWGETIEQAYNATIEIVNKAELYIEKSRQKKIAESANTAIDLAESRYKKIAHVLRGLLCPKGDNTDNPWTKMILTPLITEEVITILNSDKAHELACSAPLTPDYLIRTKCFSLFIKNPDFDNDVAFREQLIQGIKSFGEEYDAYIQKYALRIEGFDSTGLDVLPRVVMLPGLGAVCIGDDVDKSNIVRDITKQALRVKRDVYESGGEYLGLSSDHLFDMEFRTMQRAKVCTCKSKPLAGRVAIVTGSAGAIGSGICEELLAQGCCVAVTDLAGDVLNTFVNGFKETYKNQVLGIPLDVTDAASVASAFATTVKTFGGIDIVVINAGLAHVSALVDMDLAAFRKLEQVNVEGTLLLLAEAGRLFRLQNMAGDIVLISTKNVFAPGAKFGAYSSTKAASHQLCRIASLEFADMGVRVNMVAPDAVFSHGDKKSGLWAKVGPDRMKARGLDEKGLEEYYRQRNLLKAYITAEHVAKTVMFFVTHQTPTTGATIPVDGGLPDATPR